MPRKPGYPLYGKQYCGNIKTMEVHDLDRSNPNCKINKIIVQGWAVTFVPDTLVQAYREGYKDCRFCLGEDFS